MVEVNRLVKKL